MSNKHLSTQPYTLVKDDDNDLRTWMYEEGGGLCVVPIIASHTDETCRFRVSATCAVPIECEHGFDCCPKCDPCTCYTPTEG